ncbi:MAG TPA: hypothetical protein QGF58_03620 [Myxococcota bacterium]|nr:hypothetical protein [Myxococcota bacterium]
MILSLLACPAPEEDTQVPPLIQDTEVEDSPPDSPPDSPVDTEPPCEPISFTTVPDYCTLDDLEGATCGLEGDHHVAPYIYVEAAGGWWTKPTAEGPTVELADDGTWTVDITTGGVDESATRICAYLLPLDEEPPLALGAAELDESLEAWPSVCVDRPAPDTTLEFGERTWTIKGQCGTSYGPGPCVFREDYSTVDGDGKLHLLAEGAPYCSEVYLPEALGFGEYSFTVDTPLDDLGDVNAVLGMFLWDDDEAYNHRELDFEYTVWGEAGADNGQFVVQPYDTEGNRYRFMIDDTTPTTHRFQWTAEGVVFEAGGECWEYAGSDTPPEGDERVHINLWLYSGEAAEESWSKEVVISDFTFTAEPAEPIECD